MDIIRHGSTYYLENLNWFLQQSWFKDNRKQLLLAVLASGSSIALGRAVYLFFRNNFNFLRIGGDNDLPIGLPNNLNLCYLNALLQGMASCPSLVKSLRRCAAIKRTRLLCSLVAVLEGLGCSYGYLKRHNLVDIVLLAHKTLTEELSLTGKWAVNDQQDVHELYGFFMDLAENTEARETVIRSGEDLRAHFSFLFSLPPVADEKNISASAHLDVTKDHLRRPIHLPSSFSSGSSPNKTRQSISLSTSYPRLLTVSQIFCTKCSYRGDLRITPESCIILFPEKSKLLHTKKRSRKVKEAYRCAVEGLLNDEFCAAERLTGIHCPQCQMQAMRIPENLIDDPTPVHSDRSAARHFAETLCRNTCCSRRWIALPSTARLPIVIYMQRAVWLPLSHIPPSSDDYVLNFRDGGMMIKFTDHVDFPAILDLEPYLASGHISATVARRLNDNPSAWKISKKGNVDRRYALRSVIMHCGNTLQAGHYVAYRRWINEGSEDTPESGWILTSDRYVNRVRYSSVENCQAYMLFYEPLHDDSSQPPKPSASRVNAGGDGIVRENGEETQSRETDLGDTAPSAQRILAFMEMACGPNEIA